MARENKADARLIRVPDWFGAPEIRYADMSSVLRVRFASSAGAETYAASLAVNAAYYFRLDIADIVSELLARLAERRLPLPQTVIAHERFFTHLGARMTGAVGMGENSALLLNPAANYWRNPVVYTRAAYEARIWSTPQPLHPLIHEVGHLLQEERGTRGIPLTARELTEAQAVSQRAREGIDEFLAEVFTGLFEGVEYDAEILRLYTRYGGRQP